MEKHRASVISKKEKFVWHSRKTLSLGLIQAKFHNSREKTLSRLQEENTIYDIHIRTSIPQKQRLQIKHITGEK